jgi:rubrerythrin
MNPDPDSPIPYTLTPKAHAVLDATPHRGYDDCAGNDWACAGCGAAYFGTPPDDELCPACRATAATAGGMR